MNEMQSKLEVLRTRVNEVEERVSDIEDKLMAKRETEEKREKQLKDHEERLRYSLRRKNLPLIGVPENAERSRGPESIFEQIIAENFPNLGRETGIQIQEIERSLTKINKNHSTAQHLIVNLQIPKINRKSLKQQETRDS